MPFATCFILILFLADRLFAQEPRLMLPIGHTSALSSAQFSPDGKRIVTAGFDNTAKIWDVASGALLADLKGHKQRLISAAYSPDGKKIVTLAYHFYAEKWDEALKIWDARTGLLMFNLPGHISNMTSVQFSPDSRLILTTSEDKTAKTWNTDNGALVQTLPGHTDWVLCAAFSPDGKRIVTGSKDKTARIWDVNSGQQLSEIKGHWSWISSVEFSMDGKTVLTSSNDYSSKTWDAATGNLLTTMKGHTNILYGAYFSPDNKKIVTASWDNTARIWDAANGSPLFNLKGHTSKVLSACFSPDNKKVVTTSSDRSIKIWDVETGKLLFNLKNHLATVIEGKFSPDGKKIISASHDNTAKIWDANTSELLVELNGQTKSVNDARFSPDDKKIAIGSSDSTAKIWDTQNGILLGTLKGHTDYVNTVQFSRDGNRLLTAAGVFFSAGKDSIGKVWDIKTGQLLFNLVGHKGEIYSATFSKDDHTIITSSTDYTTKEWDANTGELIRTGNPIRGGLAVHQTSPDGKRKAKGSWFNHVVEVSDERVTSAFYLKGHSDGMNSIDFSPDGKKIVTASKDRTARLWDAETGAPLSAIIAHNDWVNSARFSTDGKKLITASRDNTIKVWTADSVKLLYTFFPVDSSDYFYILPSGYYMCTPRAAKLLHYVTQDLKVISFEQLDIKYNRPDLVLPVLGCTDSSLIQSYRRAYYKRLEKLGFDTSFFRNGLNVPEADFRNRNTIPAEQDTKKLSLNVLARDSLFPIERFNIWINEVPIFGKRGINLRNRDRLDFDTTVEVTLSKGDNRIETAVTNKSGLESYRMPIQVRYNPPETVKYKIYFIGIGIDSFAIDWYNLQYSVKDIRDLAKGFKHISNRNILFDTLFNRNVSVTNIKSLKKHLLQTTENDIVILSYSGHGLLSSSYDYYLSTYALDFQKPEIEGLSYDELENLIDSIPARMKVMFIDACHSGEVDKEELSRMKVIQQGLAKNIKGIAVYMDTTSFKLGIQNSFMLMQELFVNVQKSTGANIIAAAAGTQLAIERDDFRNGIFTYSILEAMKQHPSLSISDLKEIVGKRVTELTKGLQVPTFRNRPIYFDWKIW